MKSIVECSGPWVGQSIQEGFRITEKIQLTFHGNLISGEGSDSDGLFVLDGEYDPADQMVSITRRYTFSPRNPSQVGYPFVYIGRWDGYQVCGRWLMSTQPSFGGPFEMWPEEEDELMEGMADYIEWGDLAKA